MPPITKTIQVGRTRHVGHCWRSKDELISDVLLWTPTYGCAKVGRPARTYIQQLCEDTGCNPEDLPEAMNDREKWRERVRDIRAGGATWWWWWYIYHHHHIALVARISLTLSRHSSLSFIAPGRSSGQHPVSSHSCWMYVRAGRPAFARPCVGVYIYIYIYSGRWVFRLIKISFLLLLLVGTRYPEEPC